jgi:phosphonate transport system substrate-binding protein
MTNEMSIFKTVLILVAFIPLLLSAHQVHPAGPEQLTFGVYPYDTPTQIYQSFEPLMKHLSKELGMPVKIVIAPNYMSHIINIGEGRVDLGFMGPSPYIKAKDKYGGVDLLARLLMRDNKNDMLVFVSHKDSKITGLKDLKGKTFAFGDSQSYGSHFYPRYLLNKSGIKLRDLRSYDFLGSHSRVVLAVSHKDFDAGGVREDIYDKYRDRSVKIIAGPFAMPPHVIICRKGLPGDIKSKIRDILLNTNDEYILKSIDPSLERFAPVKDEDFRQAREVVDFVEDR